MLDLEAHCFPSSNRPASRILIAKGQMRFGNVLLDVNLYSDIYLFYYYFGALGKDTRAAHK